MQADLLAYCSYVDSKGKEAKMEEKCGNCRYFVPVEGADSIGECHRKAPYPSSLNPYNKLFKDELQTAYWAKIPVDTFCGEFKAK